MTHRFVACLPLAIAALLAAPAGAQQDPCGEFTAHGDNVVRVEDEAKLRVPEAEVEAVWQWLVERYRDCGWLDRDGHRFLATLGDEHFADTYFDEPQLRMLQWNSGVRHRQRTVRSGSATQKDGRALVQMKLATDDKTGLARSEIKWKVDPPAEARTADDLHPLLGLLAREDRPALWQRLRDLGIEAFAMRPVLTVDQVRRRVYVADQHGAIATLTLDQCSVDDLGADLHWTEIELELNEIRYTEADESTRAWMKGVQQAIQSDLLARWPGIVQDQTPKYTKAFLALEQATLWPLRTMVRWQLSAKEMVYGTWALLAGGLLALGLGGRRLLRRRHRTAA